jgi:hypothetical protein
VKVMAMEVNQNDDGLLEIIVSDGERYLIKQCLNECCHGFRISDFPGKIGASKTVVSSILDQINDASGSTYPGLRNVPITRIDKDTVRIVLTPEQGRIFVNCMNEAERTLGPSEFPSRFGASFDEVKTLFSAIEAAL